MRICLRRVLRLDAFDEPLHVLHVRAIGDEHRIGRLNYDDIGRANTRDEAPIRMRVSRRSAFEHDASASDIATFVLLESIPDGAPRAEIGPARLERHDDASARRAGRADALHNRVVDRVGARVPERLGLGLEELAVGLTLGERRETRGVHVRLQAPQRMSQTEARKTKMPLFHQYVPAATYCAASSAAGFSTKRSMRCAPSPVGSPMRM
jgi:hypothetical protein